MKTLLRTTLSMLMVFTVMTVSAQPQRGNRGERPDPEKYAKEISETMAKDLGLNDKQKQQVYDIELKAAKARPERGQGQQRMTEEERTKFREDREKRREEHQKALQKVLTKEQYETWCNNGQQRQGNGQGMGRNGNNNNPGRRANLSNQDTAVCPLCNAQTCVCKNNTKKARKNKK